MKSRLLLLCAIIFFALRLTAQDFEIVSVESLPADMSAREEMKTDHNDRQCALLRIGTQGITPEQRKSFTFKTDLGSEVVERVTRNGEIWLWVSPGLKYLRVMHRDWGQYELHLLNHVPRVEALHTYKIVIRGTAPMPPFGENNGSLAMTQQYLVFQITPSSAMLEVNGDLWEVNADGVAKNFVNFGTYNYRVQAPNYYSETNTVIVDDPENAKTVTVNLKPDFVEVTLQVDADAEIWINNEMKGMRTWKGQLGKGTFKMECKQACHETSVVSKEITAEMNGKTITLAAPKPIYGSLNIESTPDFATVYIDGKEVGKTPKSIPQILIGQHELKLTKDGYADYHESISIVKGEQKQMNVKMGIIPNKDEIFTVNGVSFTMKPVEGGIFQMGSNDNDANEDETPLHNVTVNSFYMGETEVTQALWKAVMGDELRWDFGRGDNFPVYNVDYKMWIFISKLKEITGRDFRLPTEAEWEYAARGGKKSNGNQFAGSSQVEEVAWYKNNSGQMTHEVKQLKSNELGLYDMSGNVHEWCQDKYDRDYYMNSPSTDPQGPSRGRPIVLRGGSWNYPAKSCRVTHRSDAAPWGKYAFAGFRLVFGQSSSQQTSTIAPDRVVSGTFVNGIFSISSTQKVHFSQGNLQYQPSTNSWRFAGNQWDTIDKANENISPTFSGWIDCFRWGTGDDPLKDSDSWAYNTFNDWGNRLIGEWRTLTKEEWEYVFDNRKTVSGIRYSKATVNGVNGVILLPDNWNKLAYELKSTNESAANFENNIISAADWNKAFSPAGAVFLPAVRCWSASTDDRGNAYLVEIWDDHFFVESYDMYYNNYDFRVRLVCPVKD